MDFTDLLNDNGGTPDVQSMVSQAADKYGVPRPVALAVAYHESGFKPDAVSPAGAYGVMQLMPKTAADLGADPHDPAQNIDAGVRYLAQNIERFGLKGGIAAYQAGPGAVAKNGGNPVDASDGLSTNTQYVNSVLGLAQNKFGFNADSAPKTQTAQSSLLDSGMANALKQTGEDQRNTIGSLAKLGLGLEKGGLDVVQMVSSIVGPPGVDRYRLRDWAIDKKKEIDAELANDPQARAAATDMQSAQGFWATLGALKDHPIDNVAVPIAEMVAPFLASIPAAEAGGAIGVGVAASRAGVAVGRMMGMTAQRAAQLGSAVGATLAASAEQGTQAGTTAYADIRDKLVAGGMDPDQADREATDGAMQIGLATGLLMTGGAGRVAAKIATQGANAIKEQTLKSAGVNIAENAILGGATNVATTGIEALKEREVNPEADFSLGKTFAQGAVPGALVGVLGEGVTAVKQTIKPVDPSILGKLNAAPDVQSAIDTFMGEVGKSRVDLGQGISLDSLSKLDVLNQVADTDAMRNMMAQLSPEARQQVQGHLDTALSADAAITPEMRGQSADALHQQLQDSGVLQQAQQELNQRALQGTPEEQQSIQQATDLQQTPEWQQFIANQSDNARAAIDAAAKQAADATLHDTDRAGAAQKLLDLAGENQLGIERPLEQQPAQPEPEQNPATTQLADARATLNDITQQPEWKSYLDGLKPAERADVIDKLGVVSNPKVSEGYRNAIAASLLQHAEDAGLHTPIPEVSDQGLPGKPVPTEAAQAILATTKVNPEYGTIALVDPSKFTRANLMAEGRGAVSAGQARLLQVFGRALGRTVHFFEQSGGEKQVDGFTHTDNPDVIFINREQSGAASLHAIFGHEFLHTMPDDIKKPFIEAAIKAVGPAKAEALRSYVNQPELKSAGLHEEIGADLFGNGMNRPELIARALDQMPVSLATRVVNHVRQFVAKMAARLKGVKDFDTGKFVTDAKAIDAAWVTAFRTYLQRQHSGEAVIEGRPAHQFAPDELKTIAGDAEHPQAETADLEIGRRSIYPDYEAVAALGSNAPAPSLVLPEKKDLALPKSDLSAAQMTARQKRDAGVLLSPAELDLANAPDVKTVQIERRQKPRQKPAGDALDVVSTRSRPKPEKSLEEPENAPLTELDKEEIRKELEQELENLPEEHQINEEMPIHYSTERERPEEMSTRVPWHKKANGEHMRRLMTVGLDEAKSQPGYLAKQANVLSEYPNYRPAPSANTPEKVANRFINHVRDNLLALHDAMPANIRERAKLWYDGANKIANRIASSYGMDDHQAAGVMAALSPQKDWFQNVSLAKRVIDIVKTKQDHAWDKEMSATAARIMRSPELKTLLSEIKGKKFSELTDDLQKAAWVRIYDESHNDRAYHIVSPEGEDVGFARTAKGEKGVAAWGSMSEIAKAVSIAEDGSLENISGNIGDAHKVRNFYNNILVPDSKNGHVTIDTHAVAAGLLRPLVGADAPVMDNFGKSGKNAESGLKGAYSLYAEAYRRAAAARGILPREMQSIAWEAVRSMFDLAVKRNKGMSDQIDAIWNRYKSGGISHEQAQKQIFDLVGGVKPPEWAGGPGTAVDEEAAPATEPGNVPADSVSGRGTEAVASGSGSESGGAVPQLSTERPTIMFEVAPDPNNKELADRWRALDDKTKTEISGRVAEKMIPKMLRAVGVKGEVTPQLGGYLGETNPSFSIKLAENTTPAQIERAAKVAGYMLSQDSMMVVSPKKIDGADQVGIITVSLPKDASPALVSDVYRRIYEVDDGALQGHTTVDGEMALVDFSGDTAGLAAKVHAKLDGEYDVHVDPGYASFIDKEQYDYGQGQTDHPSTGPEAAAESPLRNTANRLRAEAAAALDQELASHEGAEEGLRASVARSQINANWTSTDPGKLDNVLYNLQDKHIDTKRVLESIKEAAGKITDKTNPYLKETLYHGRAAQQTKEFLSHEMRPLMQSMVASKVTIPELNEYLHMRHAEERNRQIAAINPAFPDAASGVSTADARKYLKGLSPDRARVLAGLAKRVDAITKGTRELLVSSGLETRDTINQWERTFSTYVPLNREGFDRVSGSGQGFSVRGSASKHATGSGRPVDDILANVAMARERAITRAEKNVVGNALFGLAVQNPNPDFWLPVASARDVTNQQKMLYDLGLDPQEVKNLVNEPTKPYMNPHTGMVEYRVNPLLRNMDNVLTTRVNGRDQYLIFNRENARADRLVQSMKNLDAPQMGAALSAASTVTRYVASVNTQYNPFFGVLNILRDTGEAAINLSATPLAGRQAEVVGNIPAAVRGVMIALREERAGKPVTSTWGKLYQEFAEAGGKTGYRDMYTSSAERAKALQKEITDITAGKTKQVGRAVLGLLDDFNESLENGTRLSVYKAARDHGLSIDQAAAMAKELTVNFNRKGKISSQAGALYAFFNASVQGTATMLRTLSSPAGKKIIIGGALLGAANAVLMHAMGIDNDIPEFVKQNNLIIPTGGKGYVAIPMPLGYRIIPGVGRMLMELGLNGGRGKMDMAANMIGLAADSFNPIGNAGLSVQTIAPTFADPLVALAENRDWTGRPIAKEDFDSLHPTPGYTRAFSNASDFGKVVSQVVNTLTGGSAYQRGLLSPTPDQIDYLIGQATGGVGREAVKAEGAARAALNGEEVQLNKVPLVGRFVGTTSDQSGVSGRFYDNVRQVNALQYEAKERLKNRDGYTQFLQDNPEVRLAQEAGRAQRAVSGLKKMKQRLIEAGAAKDRVHAVDQQINAVMQRLNDSIAGLQQ